MLAYFHELSRRNIAPLPLIIMDHVVEMDDEEFCVPDDVLEEASAAKYQMVPTKSKLRYQKELEIFTQWQTEIKGKDESSISADGRAETCEESAAGGRMRKEDEGKTEEEMAGGGNSRPKNAGRNRLEESHALDSLLGDEIDAEANAPICRANTCCDKLGEFASDPQVAAWNSNGLADFKRKELKVNGWLGTADLGLALCGLGMLIVQPEYL
ncbi:hypothetical protein MTP99_011318 [Tenebrio molitor]|nr:hypothetical protein MTP99_011318 [Tenebrio molitor]